MKGERAVDPGSEPRIGVFVCHCGTNIGGIVDVPAVVEITKDLRYVVHAEGNLYTCASDGIAAIQHAIREHDLNRVVVASCTPRTHSTLFMRACADAGLNPYLFEFVNIRDQCSWVHMHEPEKATEKAKDLVRMGVAKAALLEPLEKIEIPMTPSAMVIGGGVSGLKAASIIGNSGFEVYLVEKEPELGGMVRKFHRVYPSNRMASEFLEPIIRSVEENDNVNVLTSTKVTEVKGYVGNFEVTVATSGKRGDTTFKVGTIIVATGAEVFRPDGLYGYGEYSKVMNQLELDHFISKGDIQDLKSVVMIQCCGTRDVNGLTYCSRICCMAALKNALTIKEMDPTSKVTILYRDVQAQGVRYEALYKAARQARIRFIKYSPTREPEVEAVTSPDGRLRVDFFDELIGRQSSVECDRVVLSSPLVPHHDSLDLSKILRVPRGKDKFFFEAHVKLRPVDFATDGIFLCGTAHGPKDITDCIIQALGAAGRALALLRNDRIEGEPIVSIVDESLCTGCGTCFSLCPYGAIERTQDDKARVLKALCKGCGVCTSSCPEFAIDLLGFTNEQILAQVRSALQDIPGTK